MRGTNDKRSIAYKRDVVGAISKPQPEIEGPSAVTDLAATYTGPNGEATWTRDVSATQESFFYRKAVAAAPWKQLGPDATSPTTIVGPLSSGNYEAYVVSEYSDGRLYLSNRATFSVVGAAVAPPIQQCDCDNPPQMSWSKPQILQWFGECNPPVTGIGGLTKRELVDLAEDICT